MRQQVDVLDVKAPILARTLGSKPQAWALQTDHPQLWPRWGSTASPGAYRLCLYPHHTRTSSCTIQTSPSRRPKVLRCTRVAMNWGL